MGFGIRIPREFPSRLGERSSPEPPFRLTTRPCLIVSPDEANEYLHTVIVAPMKTTERASPTRVGVAFQRKLGQVALDQIRAVDRERLVRKLGSVPPQAAKAVSAVLVEMFTWR
jgi:mRNA interferase MazF